MLPIRINEPCIACAKLGAKMRSYGWVNILGKQFGMCYRHLQCVAGVGKPEYDEEYYCDPSLIGVSGCGIPKCVERRALPCRTQEMTGCAGEHPMPRCYLPLWKLAGAPNPEVLLLEHKTETP
jgi:hypothetical protein